MSWMQDIRDGRVRVVTPKAASGHRYRWLDILFAFIYMNWETAYFGWNFMPKSGAEMACDGIALLLIIVASRPVPREGAK